MKLGDHAEITRQFTRLELSEFADLVGSCAKDDAVIPEPLLLSLFSFLLGVKLPGQGTNYLKQETQFFRPIAVGERLRARVCVVKLRPEKRLCDLSTEIFDENGAKCVEGRALVAYGDVEGAAA